MKWRDEREGEEKGKREGGERRGRTKEGEGRGGERGKEGKKGKVSVEAHSLTRRWRGGTRLTVGELVVVRLEVGFGGLRARTDGHGVVLEAVARGGELVQVGAFLLRAGERASAKRRD